MHVAQIDPNVQNFLLCKVNSNNQISAYDAYELMAKCVKQKMKRASVIFHNCLGCTTYVRVLITTRLCSAVFIAACRNSDARRYMI